MEYEDYLIREMTEGPVRWCSQCQRDAEDCVCEELSDHFRETVGNADTEDVCVPASVSAPAQWEKDALKEIDNLSGVGQPRQGTRKSPEQTIIPDAPAPAQSPMQIQNETFRSIMRHFQL